MIEWVTILTYEEKVCEHSSETIIAGVFTNKEKLEEAKKILERNGVYYDDWIYSLNEFDKKWYWK